MSRRLIVSLPEVALIGLTRAAIGLGAGLLISNRLNARQRKSIGLPLLIAGLVTTIPIAARLFRVGRVAARG